MIPVIIISAPQPLGSTGGQDEHILELCLLLEKKKYFIPHLLIFRESELSKRCATLGISHQVLGGFRHRIDGAYILNQTIKRNHEKCIIHSHGYFSDYVVYLARKLNPKLHARSSWVVTCHGWIWNDPLISMLSHVDIACTLRSDVVLTVSNEMMLKLKALGMPAERIHPMNCWARESAISVTSSYNSYRGKLGVNENTTIIGFVGRLSSEKRLDIFLKACSIVAQTLPSALFLVVGSGNKNKYDQLIKTLNIQSKVIFTGLVTNIADVYGILNVLVVSSDTEGMPHVILESWANNVPVVSTSIGGIPDFTNNGDDILLVPPAEAKAMAEAILKILLDRQLSQNLSNKAHARVTSEFTPEDGIKRIEDAYFKSLEYNSNISAA